MAKRGYKLQEFVAHSATVNCVSIGKKTCRHFITGGDDYKVNLWAVGNPTSLMSLCGHTSPVESVAFDSAEVLVLAGASTGAIKLWDLEEVKMVRTFTGHRSYCTAVEFHPFGEFFASGSMDTNLKIWDIRKKGSIHTYKGHTRGISNIKFTPDGRWVVSGGLDNIVKVWDLTAGKLLHDFKFHDGHIRALDFHPIEFLLATGSADRTVKFWDLETFELIGSTRPEASGVRTIAFHPDGRTLFCGLDDRLKVYSWEPIICHDAVDMGWSTMGDICIHEDKLVGCSYFQNSVGVWVADITLIEPYGAGLEPRQNGCSEKNYGYQGSQISKETGSHLRSSSCLRAPSPDYETKEIKNIYVDSTGGIPVSSTREVEAPFASKEITSLPLEKQGFPARKDEKYDEKKVTKSLNLPTIVPRDSSDEKNTIDSHKESFNPRIDSVKFLRPAHGRKPSDTIHDFERLSVVDESETVKIAETRLDGPRFDAKGDTGESCEEKQSSIKTVAEKFEKILSSQIPPHQEKGNDQQNSVKGINHVKYVNGVAVVRGRTRSLVERFERDLLSGDENRSISSPPDTVVTDKVPPTAPKTGQAPINPQTDNVSTTVPETDKTPTTIPETHDVPTSAAGTDKVPTMAPEPDKRSIVVPVTEDTTNVIIETGRATTMVSETDKFSTATSETNKAPTTVPHTKKSPARIGPVDKRPVLIYTPERRSSLASVRARRSSIGSSSDKVVTRTAVTDRIPASVPEMNRRASIQSRQPQSQMTVKAIDSGNDVKRTEDGNLTEDLMQTHDSFLSNLRSRLTKLQVVRHFWERNDIKGAISAMRKLPDHSVQADVLSGMMEKMDILTLDLFSCLLPILVGLLDSKTERHIMISLEMLLKLGAVFAPVIRWTVSAPPLVGVDLHAEQRLQSCNQCFVQLQKIQNMVPELVRRGGMLARSAQELNLVLQQ